MRRMVKQGLVRHGARTLEQDGHMQLQRGRRQARCCLMLPSGPKPTRLAAMANAAARTGLEGPADSDARAGSTTSISEAPSADAAMCSEKHLGRARQAGTQAGKGCGNGTGDTVQK